MIYQPIKKVTHAGVRSFLIGSLSLFALNNPLSAQPVGNGEIQSAFGPKKQEWNISWPGRIAQYDLVYQSPPIDPLQGFPLGNGETATIKTSKNEVITIIPEGCEYKTWTVTAENPASNQQVKYHSSGKTRLGIPRMY